MASSSSSASIPRRNGFVAEGKVLAKHESAHALEGNAGIAYKGWIFTSHHAVIADEARIKGIDTLVSTTANTQALLKTPEMIFDRNILQIENATRGIRLKFCAEDALVAWAARHNEKTISSPPSSDANSVGYNQPSHDDISVPYASKFQEGIQENIRRLKGWDWTFCSDYCGSISEIDTCRNEGSFQINNAYQVKDDNGMIDRYIMNPRILNQIATNSYSSSCSTSYKIRMLENNGEVGIDFDILRKREDILFFDEAVLYQGDLEDCGEVIFDYKVRVMPSCWFVLVRLFLRVDNAETRIRSYRYYHNFDSNKIDLNISWQVGSAEKMKEFRDAQLAENTTRLQIPTRSSPSTAATPGGVFRGVGGAPDLPAEVVANNFLRDANKLSEILPSVNDIEIIPQNVVLEFR